MNISDMMDTSILSKVFMLWANRFQHTMRLVKFVVYNCITKLIYGAF